MTLLYVGDRALSRTREAQTLRPVVPRSNRRVRSSHGASPGESGGWAELGVLTQRRQKITMGDGGRGYAGPGAPDHT